MEQAQALIQFIGVVSMKLNTPPELIRHDLIRRTYDKFGDDTPIIIDLVNTDEACYIRVRAK